MTIERTAHLLFPFKPAPKELPSKSFSRVHQIALRILTELVIGLSLTAICIPFVSTWILSMQILIISLASVALNAIIQLTAKEIPPAFCGSNFSIFNAANAMTLIHETGHFSAAKLLFKGQPQIQIIPFIGGWTKWSTRQLTPLGLQLGFRNSILIITLAGTGLALLAAGVMLIAGLVLRHSHPHAGDYVISMGSFPFFIHAEYALSALWTSPSQLGHDFVRLKTFGIHPISAFITILSIPVIIYLGTVLVDQKQSLRLHQPAELILG